MPRSQERFKYYRIGIPLDTDLLAKIAQDAKESGMTTEVAKLLVVRLADYYQGKTALGASPSTEEVPHQREEGDDDMERKRKNAFASADDWE